MITFIVILAVCLFIGISAAGTLETIRRYASLGRIGGRMGPQRRPADGLSGSRVESRNV
jgi:hypothetical protein